MVLSGSTFALLTTAFVVPTFAAPTNGFLSGLSGLKSGVTSMTSGLTGSLGQKSKTSVSSPQFMGGPVGSIVGAGVGAASAPVMGVVECFCSQASKCTVTINGPITDILGNGADYKGNLTISAWIQDGHAWGSMDSYGQAAAPFTLKCNQLGDVCSSTIAGNLTQVFDNGEAIQAWGWLTPSGKCDKGVCTGEIHAVGDPGY